MKRTLVFLVLLALACSTAKQASSPAPAGVIEGVVLADGGPLPGATVTITAPSQQRQTTVSDSDGRYAVRGLPEGTYTVKTELQGFSPQTRSVVVTREQGASLVTELSLSALQETITVTAASPGAISTASVASSFVGDAITEVQLMATMYGGYSGGGAVGVDVADPRYATIEEHGFTETRERKVATFAIDVDRASYANVRRHLNNGLRPPPDAVRIEEMLNYFTYSYPQPENDAPFSITSEVAGCPWNPKHRLLRVGIQGRALEQWRMAPNNLVFLIDVSGSMADPHKLKLIVDAFTVLVQELRAEDRVAIVVYAGAAGVVLPPTSGADKQAILDKLQTLQAGGSTAGGAGIRLAYQIARENFLENGNNRVILATDGDFNVGLSSIDALRELIETQRRSGIFLSVLGVGAHDLQDAKMEMLADSGNGNYSYLDSLEEAEKVFKTELTGTLVTIAKDVKVQLEFDPKLVASYRQIGYENRALAAKDFDDDEKDAGELGAGHSVTALFELVPASPSARGRIATLRLRYKEPKGARSTPLVREIVDQGVSAYEASPDLQFAAAVAELGMLLRDSPHKGDASWDDVFHLASLAQGADLDGRREEFMKLAKAAKALQ